MYAGDRIRQRRLELGLKPVQIERLAREYAARTQDPRCAIPHPTLAGIEAGATPTLSKMLSLAYCLRVTEEQMLEWYGISLPVVRSILRERAAGKPESYHLRRPEHPVYFPFGWPAEPASSRTVILPRITSNSLDHSAFRYARIGTQDDGMMDIVPSGAVVCVDSAQRHVLTFQWPSLWHRPIYLVWHPSGHSCCWCQQNGNELLLICHPGSQFPVRRYRTPRDANIIGRIVSVWTSADEQPLDLPIA